MATRFPGKKNNNAGFHSPKNAKHCSYHELVMGMSWHPWGWSFHPAKNAKWGWACQHVSTGCHDTPMTSPPSGHRGSIGGPVERQLLPLLWPDERGPWLGELSHGGTPIAGWFRTDNPKVKWRIFILIWGYPHFRKLPIFSIVFCVWPGQWIYRILTCWEFRSKIHGGSPGIWWRIHHRTKRTMLPGLVNVNIANWKIHPFFHGEIHYFIYFYGL